ncbi:glycosyltransferase family 1 protein [Flavobacterium sp. SUN052]|uniref:glycosyltransferase family 4 protein n=1 Tax=Flavobacterium sp. SUN052 TaxID=3002441 RepID=UPI00237E80FF|nr:glycosyltransferase family 1 protein [Flavobacterium sp. SUN052]MEC4005358.1 glycosyltransferase family 1 protein [Flavobacterium sp. SUN052]
MRILLDPEIFNEQKFGGISRYYVEIFSNISYNQDVKVNLPVISSENIYVRESVFFTNSIKSLTFCIDFLKKIGVSLRKKVKKKNTAKTIQILKNQSFDLFIPTYYNPYFLEFLKEKPFVLTVYDMIHELFPHYFDDGITAIQNKLLLLEKATKIIAVSQNTKNDIIKIYPHIDATKIEVIYHGNSIIINDIFVDLPKKYILFVGVRRHYKNFIFLVNSIKDLLVSDRNLYVVCAGGGKFEEEEITFINELGLQNQIIQKPFQENELGQFYKNAQCFVFPSAYEGFGIPVVEAMSCGCPIVLTNNSSFPEVAGDAGIFFELNDATDLKNKVSIILENETVRNEYINKGLERAKIFNWKLAADKCYTLYQKAINKP